MRRYIRPAKPEGSDRRRVYVLPSVLVEQIHKFGHDTGCKSEVEAVRKLLDAALRKRGF
jgi:hypothetical protein